MKIAITPFSDGFRLNLLYSQLCLNGHKDTSLKQTLQIGPFSPTFLVDSL